MPKAQARAVLADNVRTPAWAALQQRYARKYLGPARVALLAADLQDEIETLTRELNRVRLPMPTDLRYWARKIEDLAYRMVPAPYRPPAPLQIPRPGPEPPSTLHVYELARQGREFLRWVPAMRLRLQKEIAKANLRGQVGTVDLDLTPSLRAIDAATTPAGVTAAERQQAARIAAAKRTSGRQSARKSTTPTGVRSIAAVAAGAPASMLTAAAAGGDAQETPQQEAQREADEKSRQNPQRLKDYLIILGALLGGWWFI